MATVPNEDEILRRLADEARRRPGDPARPEAPARPEESELADEIANELLDRRAEALFGADFRAQVASKVHQRRAESAATEARPSAAPGPAPPAATPAAAVPLPHRAPSTPPRGWRRRALALAASLALAVAAFWIFPSPEARGPAAPVPAYALTIDGVSAQRGPGDGASPSAIRAIPGLRFEVHLRPAEPPDSAVGLRIFAIDDLGQGRIWRQAESRASIADSGVVIIDRLEEPDWEALPEGNWTLLWVVGPSDDLPSLADLPRLEAALEDGRAEVDPWRVLAREVELSRPDPRSRAPSP